MAVSHQSGTILHHWNDAPTKFIVKNKSAASSTISLTGIPTPPATPSQETRNESVVSGLNGLLDMSNGLIGRNREMVFARIRTLIKNVEEGKVSGTLPLLCWDKVLMMCRFTVRGIGGRVGGCVEGRQGYCQGESCSDDE
jgi:hypothetical protein